jgi:hypothetical protein
VVVVTISGAATTEICPSVAISNKPSRLVQRFLLDLLDITVLSTALTSRTSTPERLRTRHRVPTLKILLSFRLTRDVRVVMSRRSGRVG